MDRIEVGLLRLRREALERRVVRDRELLRVRWSMIVALREMVGSRIR